MFIVWSSSMGPMIACITFVIVTIVVGFAVWVYSSYGNYARVVIRNIAIGVGISLVAFNGLTALVSFNAQGERSATASEVAEQFGAKSDTAYPLQIGDRISGTSGVGSLSGGLFSISGSISMQPGSAVSVGFDSNDWSYIMTLPTSSISFKKVPDAVPTMTLFFSDKAGYYPSETTFTHGPCEWGFVNLLFQCVKPTTGSTVTLDKTTEVGGLAKFITDNPGALTGVQITLTPEQYNQLVKPD